MADLALVTSTQLEIDATSLIPQAQVTSVAEAALSKGDVAVLDATTGKFQKADADADSAPAACYLILRTVATGEAVTGTRYARVTGFDLANLNFGAAAYLSATAGKIAESAPSGANSVILGYVEPIFANGATADKAFMFNTL